MRPIQQLTRARMALAALALAGAAAAQTTTRMSVATGGAEGGDVSRHPHASADGRFVVFDTAATSISGAAPGEIQVMVHDRDPDGNGILDEGNGQVDLLSQSINGGAANSDSSKPRISADARWVTWQSAATDLIANDMNGKTDVFLCDRDPDGNGAFEPLSIFVRRIEAFGLAPNGHSTEPRMAADGGHVAFLSTATNLVFPDANGSTSDVFRYDRLFNHVARANSTPSGGAPNGPSSQPAISGDGSRVLFYSPATNIVAGPLSGFGDIYCRDFGTGTTGLVNKDSNGNLANNVCDRPAISADGDTVAFSSHATNLDPRDTDSSRDVYVHTLSTGVTELVSLNSLGLKGNGNGTIAGHEPALSSDGSMVCFWSRSTNLYYNQNVLTDIYVHDRTTGQTLVTSVDSAGYPANASSGDFHGNAISGDGRTVVFFSSASNLVGGDTNGVADVFAHAWCNPLLDMGYESIGSNGFSPVLEACGGLTTGQQITFRLRHAPPNARSGAYVSLASNPRPRFGGTLVPAHPMTRVLVKTDANGEATLTQPAGGGQNVFVQWLVRDWALASTIGMSNAVCAPMGP